MLGGMNNGNKNKVGFADSISVVDFVDIPEISKTIFPA